MGHSLGPDLAPAHASGLVVVVSVSAADSAADFSYGACAAHCLFSGVTS